MLPFNVVVVGLGVQGKKRQKIAQQDCIATVDPIHPDAAFRSLDLVSLDSYQAALICTPDHAKEELLSFLIAHGKHVLVEKPLLTSQLHDWDRKTDQQKTTCYTAYNHRFEPHFIRMKELIQEKCIGQIYCCKLFYGNGTARDVRNSLWRDQGAGVLLDLGSHLMDTLLFWFGHEHYDFRIVGCHRFENSSPDHVILYTEHPFPIHLEMSLVSWRNQFRCELIGELGSIHIESLCKWGPSQFIIRKRAMPSGRPDEEIITLTQPDPTWKSEYTYFKSLCAVGRSNLQNDIWIRQILAPLCEEVNPCPLPL